MKESSCPICGKPVENRSTNPSYPFCSQRCRLLDLGNWLGEGYRIPDRFVEDEDDAVIPDHLPNGEEEER